MKKKGKIDIIKKTQRKKKERKKAHGSAGVP